MARRRVASHCAASLAKSDFPKMPSVRATKAKRRMPARNGVRRPDLRPPKPAAKPLRPKQSLAEAAPTIATDAVAMLLTCWQETLAHNSAESVHKLRVSLRQLRVVLRVFSRADRAGQLKQLQRDLGALARQAGRQRDLDVMLEVMVRPLHQAGPSVDLNTLLDELERARERAQKTFATELGGAEAVTLQQQVQSLPAHLSSGFKADAKDARIGKWARRNLRRRWRNLKRQAGDFEALDAHEMHEMRKSLKKMRYAFELFRSFWPKDVGNTFLKRAQKLQSTFGYLNDVENAKSLEQWLGAAGREPELERAIGFVNGVHTERAQNARRKIARQWYKLCATEIAHALAGH